jgi:hypothetical protein
MRCVLALVALTAGCDFFHDLTHERNPGFCCEDPAWCKQWNAPGPIACENPGEVCDVVNNVCILAECSGNQECTDPAQAICMRGRCESCADNMSCASLEGKPICDDGTCRACRSGDCSSGVCDTATGACVAESDVAYVSKSGQDSGTCTQSAPCRSIGRGIDQLGARRWLHVAASGEAYAETAMTPGAGVLISGKTVSIVGAGATLTTTRNGDAALLVEGPSTIVVEGLRIANAGGTSGDGIACRNIGQSSPMLTVRSVEIRNNGGRGVNATSCALTVEASTIANNPGGGIQTTGGSVTILNNMIVSNGANTPFGGARIDNPESLIFRFNTIADNLASATSAAGVRCEAVAGQTLSDNIIVGVLPDQVSAINCTLAYNLSNENLGGNNITTALPASSLFVRPADGDYHSMATSPAVGAADPAALVSIDFDGDPRPMPAGTRADIGADEVAP